MVKEKNLRMVMFFLKEVIQMIKEMVMEEKMMTKIILKVNI